MPNLIYEIEKIPDLALTKYQSLADSNVAGVISRHRDFLRQWHRICQATDSSLHLIYLIDSSKPIGQHLRIYLVISASQDNANSIDRLLEASPLFPFFNFTSRSKQSSFRSFEKCARAFKRERTVAVAQEPNGNTRFATYVPSWTPNSQCRMLDCIRTMQALKDDDPINDCAFRVDIFPCDPAENTKKIFDSALSNIKTASNNEASGDGSRRKEEIRNLSREMTDWLEALEETPSFTAEISAFSDNYLNAKLVLSAAVSESLREGDFTIREAAGSAFQLFDVPASAHFPPSNERTIQANWSATYLLDEIDPLFRLPALFDGEALDIPKETSPVEKGRGLKLGHDSLGHPVTIPYDILVKHAFFTGMPGSGKTFTMLHVATSLHDAKIPFLALEPAKKEYRELLAVEGMEDVFLFSPHLNTPFPLRVNPFEFPVGTQLSSHIDAILEVFEGSFELVGPARKYLSSSIERAYTELGWFIDEINLGDRKKEYPTLSDVYRILEREIESSGYSGDFKGDLTSFLQVRLGGLMERDAGEVFNARRSTVPPECWINISAIVELEVLSEGAKNFFVLLICHYIAESLRIKPPQSAESSSDLPNSIVRHAIFLEEAHNLLAPESYSTSDSVNPKISATAYIVKMLAEVRALKEAIIIADQLPTAIAVEVTKNTGLKVVHRLTAQDDREVIGAAISASPAQLEQMTSFTKGGALVHYEGTMRPFWVQVERCRLAKENSSLEDEQLSEAYRGSEPWHVSVSCAIDNFCLKEYSEAIELYSNCLDEIRPTTLLNEERSTRALEAAESANRKIKIFEALESAEKALRKLDGLSEALKVKESQPFFEDIAAMRSQLNAIKEVLSSAEH